ncbi:hypothetical protein MMC17_010117 [Xylographa soralifera]|nr:hypothetical protein [Xylographa soralifera]
MLVVFLNSSGEQIMETPQTRIYESVICYRYYEKADPSKIRLGRDAVGPGAIAGVDEVFCKADEVQDELAMLNGILQLLDGVPSLALAVPFGWAADRFGRWPFVFMNLIQYALRAAWTQFVTWHWQAFDIRIVWFVSAMNILGGGSQTASALFFVVASDITLEVDRAATFLRIGAASLTGSFIMPPLAAWLMQRNPWIPSLCGTAFMIVTALLWLCVPETLVYLKCDAKTSTNTMVAPLDLAPTQLPITVKYDARWTHKLKSAMSFLIDDWRVPALITPFIAHILVGTMGRLLLQYTSKRYGLTLSASTLLITIRNGVTVLLLFVILPYLSTAVMRMYHLGEQKKDLYLARASQIVVAVGWLGVAASPNVPTVAISLAIASLGSGSMLLVRSFLASLVPAHQVAKVYSIIVMTDTLGTMFGAPLIAGLFKQGLAWGGRWIGLPFGFIGFLSTFFAGLLFVVKLRQGEGEENPPGTDDEYPCQDP